MEQNYLESTKKVFQYYRNLGQKAIQQCPEQDLFTIPTNQSNSISIIVKHLHGNMLSRWTDFLDSDGEKETRDRDGEFEASIKTKQELFQKYDEGWDCLMTTIEALSPDDVQRIVYIRNQGHTALEAINRQLAHVPYHIGQIVYLSRMFAGDSWQSLSIAKGESAAFNKEYFSKEKGRAHFTDHLK